MIKGVNRQVLEIKDTGCEYFTQALFSLTRNSAHYPKRPCAKKPRRPSRTRLECP